MGALDTSINETHLIASTTDQKYPLGYVYRSFGNEAIPSIKEYIYVKAVSTTLDATDTYAITRSTSADYTGTIAAATDIDVMYGVALYTIAIGSYGFLQITGNVSSVAVNGTVTSGHAVRPIVGSDHVEDEGSATISSQTIGIATSTSASFVSMFLFGKPLVTANGVMSISSTWRARASGTTLNFEYSTDNFATVAYTDALEAGGA